MSVAPYTPEEVKPLAQGLKFMAMGSCKDHIEWCIYSDFNLLEQKTFDHKPVLEADIDRFVFRCYLANQLAFAYTYGIEGDTLEINVKCDFSGVDANTSPKRLYDQLHLLEYNTVSQGGTHFLSRDDEQRMDRLQTFLLKKMAGEY